MASLINTSSEQKSNYTQCNTSEVLSDIPGFVKLYRDRILQRLKYEDDWGKAQFVSFAKKKLSITDQEWLYDNTERFLKDTPNGLLVEEYYLRECGYILSMIYSKNGEKLILGFSSGLIQMRNGITGGVLCTLRNIQFPPKPVYALQYSPIDENVCYAACMDGAVYRIEIPHVHIPFIRWNYLLGTQKRAVLISAALGSLGITKIKMLSAIPKGAAVCVDNLSPGIVPLGQRNGRWNWHARNCSDFIDASATDLPGVSIRADPLLESLTTQFYGSPGMSAYATPFITQRTAALSLGILSDQSKMAVGYADTAIRLYDMETQEVDTTYKIHKLRLQFIPKKLQRMHFGQVVALRAHPDKPHIFASGAYDKTLRIWDVRCQVGCVMTFEGVNICSDSIDLLREQCITGSWQTTEALSVWDLTAKKRLNVIRVQNRRPDVDGEYIYACRYWRSTEFNRKGKYGIIGGSGTNCVEIINLHNRYITCSYPAAGTVLAIASHQERIAFGGTHPALSIVAFHDPKHEKGLYDVYREPEFVYQKPDHVCLDDDKFSTQTPLTSVVMDTLSQFSVSTNASTAKSLIENKLKS